MDFYWSVLVSPLFFATVSIYHIQQYLQYLQLGLSSHGQYLQYLQYLQFSGFPDFFASIWHTKNIKIAKKDKNLKLDMILALSLQY